MSLTLRIQNRDRLEEGGSLEFVRRRAGGVIGSASTNDWWLPGARRYGVSLRHCEIQFRDGRYYVADLGSSFGTRINDSDEPITEPHPIAPGDRIVIGDFEILATISGEALEVYEAELERIRAAQGGQESWAEWEGVSGAADPSGGGENAEGSGFTEGWWKPAETRGDVSEWADRPNEGELAPGGDDIFGSLTDNHKVDWATAAWDADISESSSFDEPSSEQDSGFAPLRDDWSTDDPFEPLESSPRSLPTSSPPAPTPSPFPGPDDRRNPGFPASGEAYGRPERPPVQAPPPPPAYPEAGSPRPHNAAPVAPPSAAAAPPPAAVAASDAAFQNLVRYMGVDPARLTESPEQTAERTGKLIHRLLAGLMTLIEARARAKDQMGATATQLQFDGNNPLKFARSVEQALEMTLNPPMRGYMDADRAVEDAFRDLQAHQIATLKAMQGALQATLQRFSPQAIAARTEEKGGLAKLIPGQREAELWKAYEKEFGGVAQGSAEAFLEVFSSEFRKAYEEAARGR